MDLALWWLRAVGAGRWVGRRCAAIVAGVGQFRVRIAVERVSLESTRGDVLIVNSIRHRDNTIGACDRVCLDRAAPLVLGRSAEPVIIVSVVSGQASHVRLVLGDDFESFFVRHPVARPGGQSREVASGLRASAAISFDGADLVLDLLVPVRQPLLPEAGPERLVNGDLVWVSVHYGRGAPVQLDEGTKALNTLGEELPVLAGTDAEAEVKNALAEAVGDILVPHLECLA